MADHRATEARQQLVAAVREHAVANYDKGGWDVIVEAWEDEQIIDQIGEAFTAAGAIRKMRGVVSVFADHEADARNSAF